MNSFREKRTMIGSFFCVLTRLPTCSVSYSKGGRIHEEESSSVWSSETSLEQSLWKGEGLVSFEPSVLVLNFEREVMSCLVSFYRFPRMPKLCVQRCFFFLWPQGNWCEVLCYCVRSFHFVSLLCCCLGHPLISCLMLESLTVRR